MHFPQVTAQPPLPAYTRPPPPPPPPSIPFQLTNNITYPIAPALFSPPIESPLVDLDSISVGALANIAKTAKRLGRPAYSPIDINTIAQSGVPYVEPARIEVRLNEFYRRLDLLINPKDDKCNVVSVNVGSKRDRSAVLAAVEKYGSGIMEEEEEKLSKSSGYAMSNKQARYQALLLEHQQQMHSNEIGSDNIGHSMLSHLGWESGHGLGSKGNGLQVPIPTVLKNDKTGLGATAATNHALDYRNLMSTDYKLKIQERETCKRMGNHAKHPQMPRLSAGGDAFCL